MENEHKPRFRIGKFREKGIQFSNETPRRVGINSSLYIELKNALEPTLSGVLDNQ